MGTSIILTIHNQEAIITDIVTNLFKNTSKNVLEYIFVFDGCTDRSEQLVDSVIAMNVSNSIVKLYTPNLFETRANNTGLRAVTQDYVIIVQDDMLITEFNWDIRLVYPMKKYDDIWAVTARTAFNYMFSNRFIDSAEGPVGYNWGKPTSFPRNEFRVRSVINRGPLALDMSKLNEVGYLSEKLPGVQAWDDVELCYRIFRNKNWKCGAYWIEYYSPLHWGKTRANSQISAFLSVEYDKNMKFIDEEYADEIKRARIVDTRIIEESEYSV